MEFDNATFGTIGLESAFGALNKLIGTNDAIQLLTKGRERFGLVSPTFEEGALANLTLFDPCLLYTSPSPRDKRQSRMPSSA